ncbi:MAG: protoheme IX farnesyltransferase [Halobacteriovoraceae bacterium]|nr:protoheme IX farnesyltransferase [Halobacteriovoraceae bacterium]
MKWLKFILWVNLVLIFLLINLGGLVHNTGSSLACPDWPLCYGQVMPTMEGGILVEHSHRLLATLVGLFTILISVLGFRIFTSKSRFFKFSLLSLFLVVFQGVLGGITVIYKLPTIVSTTHLAVSMLYFASMIYLLHLVQREESNENSAERLWSPGYLKQASFLLGIVYFQIVLGASMRHLGLGSVCGTGWDNIFSCFDLIGFHKGFFPESAQAILHMSHRYLAYFISIVTLLVSINFYKNISSQAIKKKALILPLIIFAQIVIGIYTVATNIGVIATTLHVGGAALLFAVTWKLVLNLYDLKKKSSSQKKAKDFISNFLSITKPRLSGLVIFTSAMGMYLAPGSISPLQGVFALLSITGLVAGSCILNCWLEREVDGKMERTADRPLVTGEISEKTAFYTGLNLIIVSSILIFFFSNILTTLLGVLAAVLYVWLYTPSKQKSPYAVFWGAIPGAMPPLMGQTAVTGTIEPLGVILFCLLFLWQLPHFLAISLMHSKDYEAAGIVVFPNSHGTKATIIRIFHFSVILMVIAYLPIYLGLIEASSYKLITLFLGLGLCLLAVQGLVLVQRKHNVLKWAKKFFIGTLIYLPVQLTALIVLYKE